MALRERCFSGSTAVEGRWWRCRSSVPCLAFMLPPLTRSPRLALCPPAGAADDSPPGAPGITEHRISPDGPQPSRTGGAVPLMHEAAGSGRVRQVTLLPAKQ